MTSSTHVDTAVFRQACGNFPTGVTAVTAVTPDGDYAALTINSFTSVSLEPAIVLFCLADSSSSFDILQRASRIAIHILSQDQEDIARRFATSGLTGNDKLAGVAWSTGPGGVPLLPGTPAILAGTTAETIVSGDHVIFLVEVSHIDLNAGAPTALSFYRGRFAAPGT